MRKSEGSPQSFWFPSNPIVAVRQDANRMQFAAGEAVGVARVVELVCAAGEAKDLWEEAFNVAVEARQYADVMQDAAEKAEDLAQVAQAGSSCARFDCSSLIVSSS